MNRILRFTIILILFQFCSGQHNDKKIIQKNMESNLEKATFGGGCYWCTEAVFEQLMGVKSVISGYAGGHKENPTYEEVSTGNTGHAEVIQIVFDPKIISYEDLLDVFWTVHDPTQLNRQGNDIGEQYRSIILYENDQQKLKAEKSLAAYEATDLYDGSYTTEIVPLKGFYTAEARMQNYYQTVGDANPYCSIVIKPKIDKFYKKFHDKLKPEYR